MAAEATGTAAPDTIGTNVPAGLDRLPWSGSTGRRHRRIPLDREVALIARAPEGRGSANRNELRRPGPRTGALLGAVAEAARRGRIRRLPKGRFAPATPDRDG